MRTHYIVRSSIMSGLLLASLTACSGESDTSSSTQDESLQSAALEQTAATGGTVNVITYDTFQKTGGYTLADYNAKWTTPYGLGEMANSDTRAFDNNKFSIGAAPFTTGADFSVFDHIKYMAVSTSSFAVPSTGSVTYSMDIKAETPGTIPNLVVNGTYGPGGSYPNGAPYSASVREGQQAAVTIHLVDPVSGQLFDWFVSQNKAFALYERLPSAVTNPQLPASDPNYVGKDKMFTQIVKEVSIAPCSTHKFSIRYGRTATDSYVEYYLDAQRIAKVSKVGVPLDVQRASFTGTYASLGGGEILKDKINGLVIAHGLFSLLDAFPFQHPDVPELSVSIPMANRLYGQGARGQFDNATVVIQQTTE